MASRAAHRRLTREYKTIAENPPPYITAHPSDFNILEWHYVISGPEDTPYHTGQYWGTLIFPANYPFAPPAIRMHTPSGRFQPSTRLCLSISDFHPKTFNPAWEVSTILIGLLSFMTSEEMTTGSIASTDVQRRALAAQSRWWNSTGGGSLARAAGSSTTPQKGNVKAGDGGDKFRREWPDIDAENQIWLQSHRIDLATGEAMPPLPEYLSRPAAATFSSSPSSSYIAAGATCAPHLKGVGAAGQTRGVVDAVVQGRRAPWRLFINANKILIAGGLMFLYVLVARLLSSRSG